MEALTKILKNISRRLIRRSTLTIKPLLEINTSIDSDYHTQINNKNNPLSACNVTSAVMALKNCSFDLKNKVPEGVQEEDYLMEILQSKEADKWTAENVPWLFGQYPNNEIWASLAWGINKLEPRAKAVFSDVRKLHDIVFDILDGKSTVIGGKFGNLGHIVCLSGIVTKQENILEAKTPNDIITQDIEFFIIDDPYGNYHTKYKDRQGNNIYMHKTDFVNIIHHIGVLTTVRAIHFNF